MSTKNAKHTPGPWSYREVTENGVFKWSYAIESPVREFDERSSIVTVAHLTTGIGGEHEANAALIAQAPTMAARIAELERTLAAVTAQRDQCVDAMRSLDWAAVQLAGRGFVGGERREKAEARVLECSAVARAALRACEAEGGAK